MIKGLSPTVLKYGYRSRLGCKDRKYDFSLFKIYDNGANVLIFSSELMKSYHSL